MAYNAGYNVAVAITKSDTVIIPQGMTHGIYVGGAGDVVVVFEDGSTCTFACGAGQILPVRAVRVHSTGTTATGLVALYQR